MSKYKTAYILKKELKKLNEDIDYKIIKGVSYRREALRHRYIRTQLEKITTASRAGWLKSFGFFVPSN